MKDRDPPSLAIRLLGPPLFIVGALATLFWFGSSAVDLLNNLGEKIVKVDKGSFYLFGVGFGLAILSFVLVFELWYGKPLNKKLTRVCAQMSVASIVALLVLPQVLHFAVDKYLISRGFSVCEKASQQWLFVSEIVYVDAADGCR